MSIPNAITPDERAERAESVIAALQSSGRRMSAQRRSIIEALMRSQRHPGAEELYAAVRQRHPAMSRATVYKALDLLKASGEVLELEFRGAGNRYDGFRPYAHPHAVCTVCGAVEDVPGAPLTEPFGEAAERLGYRVVRSRIDLYVICPRCQANGLEREAAQSTN